MRRGVGFRKRRCLVQLTCLLFGIGLAGCVSVKLVADYDQQTDQSVSELQRKCETFLTYLERNAGKPEAQYDANKKFYDGARIDLSAIRVRAAAIPKNELTLRQLDLQRSGVPDWTTSGKGRSEGRPWRSSMLTSY
jgi:hypothetical protein